MLVVAWAIYRAWARRLAACRWMPNAPRIVKAADAELMQQMAAGSTNGFFATIRREHNRHNVCGVSPFYLMLRLLGDVEGQILAYDQCPADQANASLVSVCGMVFG